MSTIRERLLTELQRPLPGLEAQLRMAHPDRAKNVRTLHVPADARISSVLLLLHSGSKDLHFPLIVRPEYTGVHSGQVALPGGKQESGDTSLSHTALREAHEEIGIPPTAVEVLGSLTPLYIPPSGFLVHPFVGWLSEPMDFQPDPVEVATILQVGVEQLLLPENESEEYIRLSNGTQLRAPSFLLQGQVVWGATAMILSEFREVWLRANSTIE